MLNLLIRIFIVIILLAIIFAINPTPELIIYAIVATFAFILSFCDSKKASLSVKENKDSSKDISELEK